MESRRDQDAEIEHDLIMSCVQSPSRNRIIGIDNTITVEPAGLAASSVGIDSTASRVIGYLSKSRSKRISESLLVDVISLVVSAKFENPRGRDVFLPRLQSQDEEVGRALNTSAYFTPRPSSTDELARPTFNRMT
ncbi:hypothetical protein ACFX1Z_016169 [Malus domestica]